MAPSGKAISLNKLNRCFKFVTNGFVDTYGSCAGCIGSIPIGSTKFLLLMIGGKYDD